MIDNRITIAVVLCGDMNMNGISKVIENYSLHINSDKFNIRVIAGEPIADYFTDVYAKAGIELIHVPNRKSKTIKYCIQVLKELKKQKTDILHVHGSSEFGALELFLGYMVGIKNRIFHGHNKIQEKSIIRSAIKPFFSMLCTDGFACGEMVGDGLFGKGNYLVIPNGFNTKEFQYSEKDRVALREKLGFVNKIVIGHIGIFNDVKNQEFLIDIFEEIAQIDKRYVLLFVGVGNNLETVKEKANYSPFKDRIIFYGRALQPQKLYNAMDIFVLPSKYEGLPIVLLEAQISGLKCFVSERVSREVDFGDITFLSIDGEAAIWAEKIIEYDYKNFNRKEANKRYAEQIKSYDINENVKYLEEIYDEIIDRRRR